MEIFVVLIHNRDTPASVHGQGHGAWAICGFAARVEWFDDASETDLKVFSGKENILSFMIKKEQKLPVIFILNTPADGVPYWDTGAPDLYKLGDYLNKPADPFNDFEPVDSSAAAIAAQGLLRFGRYLQQKGRSRKRRSLLAGRTYSFEYNF